MQLFFSVLLALLLIPSALHHRRIGAVRCIRSGFSCCLAWFPWSRRTMLWKKQRSGGHSHSATYATLMENYYGIQLLLVWCARMRQSPTAVPSSKCGTWCARSFQSRDSMDMHRYEAKIFISCFLGDMFSAAFGAKDSQSSRFKLIYATNAVEKLANIIHNRGNNARKMGRSRFHQSSGLASCAVSFPRVHFLRRICCSHQWNLTHKRKKNYSDRMLFTCAHKCTPQTPIRSETKGNDRDI